MNFSAVVMAGGRSSRMGTDKAFLRVGRESLLERQLRSLREAGATELLISGRIGVEYSGFDAHVVYDEQADLGPLAGVAAALQASSCQIVLVLAVDMPAMTTTMLRKILSRCGDKIGCVPCDSNGFQPLAAAYPKTLLSLAQQHLKDGALSMNAFVKQAIARNFLEPLDLASSERINFVNWNQPTDWPLSPSSF